MQRRLAVLVTALCLVAGVPAVAPVLYGVPLSPTSAQAKSCSSGFTHAVIGGTQKCLRRGQYCARGADSTYRRYGFHCRKRDARGSYHLT